MRVLALFALFCSLGFGQFFNAKKLGGKPLCSASITTDCVPSTDASGNVAIATTVLGPKTIGAGDNQLPAAAAGNAGWITVVTDGAHMADCTAGGGATVALCRSDGTAWRPLGGAPIIGVGANTGVVAATTAYWGAIGGAVTSTTEANASQAIPRGGRLSGFYLRTRAAQPANGTLVCTLMKNTQATAAVITVGAGAAAGTFSDLAHTVDVVAGDLLDWRCANSSADTTSAGVTGIYMVIQ